MDLRKTTNKENSYNFLYIIDIRFINVKISFVKMIFLITNLI